MGRYNSITTQDVGICVLQREDLHSLVEELVINRFDNRDLNAPAAAQVLGVSMSTLNRWVDARVLKPVTQGGAKREERKFNLAYLLSLDVKKIKSEYRQLNK